MIAANNLFMELPIDSQIIDHDETENQKNTFVLKNRDQKENSQYRIKVKEKEGINPPFFTFLIIILVAATVLLELLTFLSFSLGNGSCIPLLVIILLFSLLIVITIKTYNGD
ncbi:MAG: hypothetical protein P8H56_09275 [Crocinitomicaceae bacterium]|nr:hypothetical protein [Crocinitomicaceae bacterium]MDG1658760.1 hypothetical protein [Crocinitomicaceae bacterium]